MCVCERGGGSELVKKRTIIRQNWREKDRKRKRDIEIYKNDCQIARE